MESLLFPLIVRSPNWLGDAVMAIPAVRNLKHALGNHPLSVAAPAKIAALWAACPFVDHVVSLDRPKSLLATSSALRKHSYKSAVLFPNSLRSAAEMRLAGVKQLIGTRGHCRAWLMTRRIVSGEFNYGRMHQVYRYLDLVRPLGASSETSMPELNLNPAPQYRMDIVVCPGAEYGKAKQWMPEGFAWVAKTMASEFGCRVQIAGMPKDEAAAKAVADGIPGSENLCGKTSFDDFIRLIAGARFVLCNDSGAMHLAAAFKVPGVAVFGSTEQRMTGPLGDSMAVVRHHTVCSPCFLRECPLDFSCMTGLGPERVFKLAREKYIKWYESKNA